MTQAQSAQPHEIPARTGPDRPELPARATGTDLPVPAPPVKAGPPIPVPAKPLPGAPPIRAGGADQSRDEEELSDEELEALTAPPKPAGPAPLTPLRPATSTGDARQREPFRPAGAPSPLGQTARGTSGLGGQSGQERTNPGFGQ